MHFRGSSAEVVPGRPGHFSSTTAHGARKVLHCRLQLFQDGLTTKVYPKLYLQLELFFRIPNSNVTDTCSSFLSGTLWFPARWGDPDIVCSQAYVTPNVP